MSKSYSESYSSSGVDITAGYTAVELMKKHIARTLIPGVMDEVGGFGGMFELDLADVKKPVLVSGTDGVGTKLKLAFLMDKHDTVGIDCVAMCVNDIICCGAKPLFFLDYIALGKNIPEKVESIVAGVSEGCVQAGCALVGGETAEMPGMYDIDEYDLAGFSVGMVDKDKILDKNKVKPGDVLIGVASSGFHSNGFSLVRKVFDITNPEVLKVYYDELGATLGEILLTPTKIYVKTVLELTSKVDVKSIAHITGGGFYENIPRALPDGVCAVINKAEVKTPPVFKLLQDKGNISEHDMFNTFNMGVGLCVCVAKEDADKAVEIIKACGEEAYVLGEIKEAEEKGIVIE